MRQSLREQLIQAYGKVAEEARRDDMPAMADLIERGADEIREKEVQDA